MYKSLIVLVAWCSFSYAKPASWQLLPPVPGYVPVYIQNGDTPLEEINLELAEAFHAIPSGRSAHKNVLATPEDKEDNNVAEEMLGDAPQPPDVEEPSSESVSSESKSDNFERETSLFPPDVNESKRVHEKKLKKAVFENIQKIPFSSEKN